MNPAGVIITYMDWSKWKTWWFNIPLFLFQLTFMVVGTVYGKIKWGDRPPSTIALFCFFAVWLPLFFIPQWWVRDPLVVVWLCGMIATIRSIPWRRVWRAAQASHVRLVLRKVRTKIQHKQIDPTYDYWQAGSDYYIDEWEVANFGYPKMEIQPWRERWNDGKRFEYREPAFPTPAEFIKPMIQYARDQVGKGYDDLQLLSTGLHLIAWIVWPWSWGKELRIIKALNRKGGREHCISGVTACLRWGEWKEAEQISYTALLNYILLGADFFPGYATATTFPCMVPISKNWRVK